MSGLLWRMSLPAMMLLAGGAVPAAIIESVSTSTSYTYDFSPGLLGTNSGTGNGGIFHLAGTDPARVTAIDIDYSTVVAPDSSFFFLNNIQCKGFCSVGITTWVTDVITNTGPDAVDLRFGSDITAGHLGLVALQNQTSSGAFDFAVTQTTEGVDKTLYSANGIIDSYHASITTSDGSVFNGLTSYYDGLQRGLDWEETAIDFALGSLGSGKSTTVTYRSVSYLNGYGVCAVLVGCQGVQVAFGDPRNKGGIINLLAPRSLAATALERQPIGYVLDREFDKVRVRTDVVIVPSGVPEPAGWALMLGGFGMVGAMLRGRNRAGFRRRWAS